MLSSPAPQSVVFCSSSNMIAILAAAILAVASAAPHDYAWSLGPRNALSDSFEDGLFDTNKFWRNFESEMQRMDEMMHEFSKRFPTVSATAGVEGNEYVITVPLTGYEEKDIVVKAREGSLMIQAAHTDDSGNQRSYLDWRTLPAGVDPSGSWTYKEGVLKVTFPLTKKQGGEDEATETATEKADENRSREEMDKKSDEESDKDADVGLDKQESDEDEVKEKEIETNEIYRNPVEATTYSVRHELSDDVEFIPLTLRH